MDKLISSKNKVLTPLGLKSIEELDVYSEVFAFDLSCNEFKPDILLEKEQVNTCEELLQIKTQAGCVYCLKENSLLSLKLDNFNNKFGYEKYIEQKQATNLTMNDYLIQCTGLYAKELKVPEYIDLLPLIQSLIKEYTPEPKLFENNDKVWICRKNSESVALPRMIKLQELVNILAWYIAEGHSKKDCFYRHNKDGAKYRSEFSQSLKANLEKVELIRNELLKAQIPAKFQFSKTLYNGIPKEMTVYLSNISAVLMQSCGCYSKEKHIANWLMNILLHSQSLREQFLYTLSLADGFNTNSRYPGFCSISDKLMEDVITLIQLSGYHYSIQSTKTKTKYINYSKLGTKSALISLGNAKFTKILEINLMKCSTVLYKIRTEKYHNLLIGDYGQILIQ